MSNMQNGDGRERAKDMKERGEERRKNRQDENKMQEWQLKGRSMSM